MSCADAQRISFAQPEMAEFGFANAHCILQHGAEHRLKLAGRACDDLLHLRSCCQLLQRFVALASTLVELFLKVGGWWGCGRSFSGPVTSCALPFPRLSALTASLHVVPGSRRVNPMQIRVFCAAA